MSTWLTLALALGCTKTPAPVGAPSVGTDAAAPATAAPAPHTREQVMHFHHSRALSSLDDLIEGDIDAARQQFDWMVLNPPPVDDLDKDAAGRLMEIAAGPSADLASAAAIQGAIGAACGDCHAQVDGGPAALTSLSQDNPPKAGHMGAHQRAIELLWQGLIIPDELSWNVGQALLADAGVLTDAEPAQDYVHPHLDALGHDLAAVHDRAARGQALAKVIATCGGCHAASATE